VSVGATDITIERYRQASNRHFLKKKKANVAACRITKKEPEGLLPALFEGLLNQ